MPAESLQALLEEGLRQLGIDLDEATRRRLIDYVLLLAKWNKAFNLTAVRDPEQMVSRHLLDSLAVAPHLSGQRIIDVGTGAGLPGIPLALAFPQREFVLLDSNSKKTRFLVQAKAALKLDNVEVVHDRVENHRPERPFDTVITRAFASLPDILKSSRHLLAPNGSFLAMKGLVPHEELAALPAGFRVVEIIKLVVPRLDEEQRHLVRISKSGVSEQP